MNIAIICGGISAEHQVSLFSAKNILNSLDKKKYTTCVIGVTTEGEWLYFTNENFLLNKDNISEIALDIKKGTKLTLEPGGLEGG